MASLPANAGLGPPPPRLRPPPHRHDIGSRYADEAAFLEDEQAWQAESAARAQLMKERQRAQQRARDRSGRQRGAGDNERRVRQRRLANQPERRRSASD